MSPPPSATTRDRHTKSRPDGLPEGQRWQAILTITLAVCMATLDTAIANTALPTIAADLHASAATSVWIVNGYQLAMIAMLLPAASLGEIFGHRRVYISGLVVFTLASLACGLAQSLPMLAAVRVVQGLGAAAVMSVNTALLRYIYPTHLLGRGLGLNTLFVALAFVVGPTVASGILLVSSWEWLFLVNVPIGIAAIVLALRALPHTPRSSHGFDPIAAVLCAGTLSVFVLGIGEASHAAPWARVLTEWAVAVCCCVALVRRQAGHPAPMLALDLLRRPVFALSSATSICTFAAQGLAFVSLPFLLQQVLGRTQVETGFLMTPWSVVVAIMAPIAGRLSDRYPAGVLCGIGLAMLSAGLLLMALLPAQPSTLDIVWRMVVCGAGFGFFQSPNLKAIMLSAPPARSGGASGIVATSRLLGQSTGAALVAACFSVAGVHGSVVALWWGSLFAGLACVASFLRLAAPTAAPAGAE
jgi:DHA2 family multidrug resistance protein-like MFS transporter